MSVSTPLRVTVRAAAPSDLIAVTEIEQGSYTEPTPVTELHRRLTSAGCRGFVVCLGRRVVGFVLAEVIKKELWLTDIAVHPHCRRQRAGTCLLEWLQDQVHRSAQPTDIWALVREHNLGAQLFFKACGFRAVGVRRNYVPLGGGGEEEVLAYEDVIVFRSPSPAA